MAWHRSLIATTVAVCLALATALTGCDESSIQLKNSTVNQNVECTKTISAHSTEHNINTTVDGSIFISEHKGDTGEATLLLSFSIDETDINGFNLSLENCSIRSIRCDYRNGLSNPWGETPYWLLYGSQGKQGKVRLNVGDAVFTFLGMSDKMKKTPSGGGKGTLLIDMIFYADARFDLYLESSNGAYSEGEDHVGFALSNQ